MAGHIGAIEWHDLAEDAPSFLVRWFGRDIEVGGVGTDKAC